MSARTLPTHTVRKLAVDSDSDPRSVEKVLRGERVLPLTRSRIEKALRAAGYGHLLSEQKGDDGPRSAA
jgi:hypothetical protein